MPGQATRRIYNGRSQKGAKSFGRFIRRFCVLCAEDTGQPFGVIRVQLGLTPAQRDLGSLFLTGPPVIGPLYSMPVSEIPAWPSYSCFVPKGSSA